MGQRVTYYIQLTITNEMKILCDRCWNQCHLSPINYCIKFKLLTRIPTSVYRLVDFKVKPRKINKTHYKYFVRHVSIIIEECYYNNESTWSTYIQTLMYLIWENQQWAFINTSIWSLLFNQLLRLHENAEQ